MKFPHFYQLESIDCGPACLRMVAKYYGKDFSLATVKKLCIVTRLGISLQDLIEGAEGLGFNVLPLSFGIEKIEEVPLPIVLHWRQEHYVVLYKIRRTKNDLVFYISDPAYGKVHVPSESFKREWLSDKVEGIGLAMEPTDRFYAMEPERREKFKTALTLKNLFLNIITENRGKAMVAFSLMLVAMACTWIFPVVFNRFVDQGVLGKNLGVINALLMAQLAIFVSQLIADSLSSILLLQINFKVSIQYLRSYLYKLIRLPLKIYDSKVSTDLLMRMDDNDRVQGFLTRQTVELVLSVLNIIIFSIILLMYSKESFLIFLVMVVFNIGWILSFLNRRKVLDYQRFSISSLTRNNINELIYQMSEIKINNAHSVKVSQWETFQGKHNAITLRALNLNYYQLIGTNFFNRIRDIFISGFCAYQVISAHMSFGVMITISFILGQLQSPVYNLLNIIRGLQDAMLSFERLEEIQKLEEENAFKPIQLATYPKLSISFRNVSFKYEGNYNPFVLNNISFSIPIGKVTAIVGSSGSGKSTIMKLLLSIYDPSAGDIYLDEDQVLRFVQPDSWRNKCGIVLQDGYIYSGTYIDNIALSDPAPDLNKVKEAARLACIDTFIEDSAMGYHTKIGTFGVGLSGGQRQRILIARAIYKDPDIIFLDEATSSLDANNEKRIVDNIMRFFKNKTLIIIAHRLSTVKNADQIIVLEKGKIVETGSHHALMTRKHTYHTLVQNQLA